jgi:AmiR/NasT family two-component response regulator
MSIFVKMILSLKLLKEVWFAKEQEATRKDVERAVGILQQRFAVVRFPSMT